MHILYSILIHFQEFIYTAIMVFFYFTAFTAQFADLYDFDSSEYVHRYDAQIVAGVSILSFIIIISINRKTNAGRDKYLLQH